MRIGILTLPFNNNYGGYLQAYALITVLKNMGHDVELINRRRNKTKFNKQITYFIKTLIKILLFQILYLLQILIFYLLALNL